VFVVSAAEPRLPLLIEDAMRPDEPSNDDIQAPHVNQDTRLDNRVIDLYVETFVDIDGLPFDRISS
jgi:aspartyl-tRNA synthetase